MGNKIDFFDTDERLFINQASKGVPRSEFTRQRFIDNLNFTLNISTDNMIISFVKKTKEKMLQISDMGWDEIIQELPFRTYYEEDNDFSLS